MPVWFGDVMIDAVDFHCIMAVQFGMVSVLGPPFGPYFFGEFLKVWLESMVKEPPIPIWFV